MSGPADGQPSDERPDGGRGNDVEERLAERRAQRRRGTPSGREALPGRTHTVRLLALTVALVVASAVVLAGVALLAG